MRRDETHCEHGTYIGYPGGADYMCQWCEDGVSIREYREIQHSIAWSRAIESNTMLDAIRTVTDDETAHKAILNYVQGKVV
jgi:hypothetical protein